MLKTHYLFNKIHFSGQPLHRDASRLMFRTVPSELKRKLRDVKVRFTLSDVRKALADLEQGTVSIQQESWKQAFCLLVAGHRRTSTKVLTFLSQFSEEVVRQTVASHPNISAQTLRELAVDEDRNVCKAALRHPQWNPAWIKEASSRVSPKKDGEKGRIKKPAVFVNPAKAQKSAEQLASSRFLVERKKALEHPGLTADLIDEMFRNVGEDMGFRVLMATHPLAPESVFKEAHRSQSLRFKAVAAGHKNTPVDVLAQLVKDPDGRVREVALNNPKTPKP